MNYNFNLIKIFILLLALSGCLGSKQKIDVNYRSNGSGSSSKSSDPTVTVSAIQLTNNQFVITGTNLNVVKSFQIKEGSTTTTLQIESKSTTSLIANTISSVTLSADKVLDFIFTSASAAATYQVNFSLCSSTLGGKSIKCATVPNDKEVLAYDESIDKWVPKNVNSLVTLNGLLYKGTWDALNDYPEPTGTYKDYYIVSEAGNGYNVGDSIVHNGTTWEKISSSLQSVFGRTGTIVAHEGDYDIDQLSDVDTTTTAPNSGEFLKFNGTNWVPGTVTETDPNVKTFAKTTLPTCGSSQVLKGDGTSLSCVTVSPGTGSAFSGNASRAVVTDAAGALAVASVTSTEIGYVAGVTSSIQTQISNLSATAAAISGSTVNASMTSGNIFVGNVGNVATSVTMSGDATIDNTGALTIAANSIALGTDTTGNYVTNITASNGLQATAAAGEGTTPNVVLGGSLTGSSSILLNGQSFSLVGASYTLGLDSLGTTTIDNVDINGGTLDNVTIGATARADAAFTTISATSAAIAGTVSAGTVLTSNILGGTTTTSSLTLKTTSGVGTTTADMHFQVGNNGATEAMTILNNGNVGIGNVTPSTTLDVNGAIRPGNSGITIGAACAAEGAIAYDVSAHKPVYCNSSSVWAVIGSSAGEIKVFGGTTVPSGYLLCDGTSYLRTTYADLYSAIGCAFGCADGTHFNVPDLRGRFLRGTDDMGSGAAARDPDRAARTAMNVGGNTGNNVGSYQDDAFQGHWHDVRMESPDYSIGTSGLGGAGGGGNLEYSYAQNVTAKTIKSDGTNGTPRSTSESRPKNVYVNFIVRF
ncbi:MAG: tail fiber protein [Bacteriovoracaceae bacterium]